MTFERPLALLLLLAVPLAWWIHRRRTGAPVVRVASLLAFRDAPPASPSAAPRRALDPWLATILAALFGLALSAAGPRLGATRPAAFYVVTDESASASARTCDAKARAAELLRAASPGAVRSDHALASASEPDGLPGSLAPHLEAARLAGFGGIVLVTDALVAAMPGVAIVGPSAGATSNLAIASASLDGDEAVVSLRNYGTSDVAAKLRCDGAVRDVAVPHGGIASASFPAPSAGEKEMGQFTGPRHGPASTFEIVSPADDLAADDRVTVERRGGARRVGGTFSRSAHLTAAVRAAGAATGEPGPWDAVVASGGPSGPHGREPCLVVGPGPMRTLAPSDARIRLVGGADAGVIRGDAVVGHGEFADVLPSPGTTLVPCGRLAGGDPIWTDSIGVLAARDGDLIVVAVDPDDPRSDWHRDPSFPAFVAAALDALTDGPDRLAPVSAVPASESSVVHEPPRTSSPDELRAVLRVAGPDPDAVRPARWLALGAALCLAAAAFLRAR